MRRSGNPLGRRTSTRRDKWSLPIGRRLLRVRLAFGTRKQCPLRPAETKDGHINHNSVKLQHKKALKLSAVRPFDVYTIRHTFLTRLGESGCDVWTLARIAGHSNIGISQRYVHPSEAAVLNTLSRLSRHNSGHTDENVTAARRDGVLLNTTSGDG